MARHNGTAPPSTSRSRRAFDAAARHRRLLLGVVLLVTLVAVVPAANPSEEEAEFAPEGDVFATGDLVEERFETETGVETAMFVVAGDDVLRREVLVGLRDASAGLWSDPDLAPHLAAASDLDAGVPVDGIFSIADVVDDQLAPGGLDAASQGQVDAALADLLAPGTRTEGLRETLSSDAVAPGAGADAWTSPALLATVAYDLDSFGVDDTLSADAQADQRWVASERFLRDVQSELRDGIEADVYGVAIDGDLTGEEQGNETAPFILGATVVIVLVIGLALRSYWAGAVVAAALGTTMIWFAAIVNLVGVKDSLLVTFIVPIATISFGVDYFVHGYGRVREELRDGTISERAWPAGMAGVIGALALALASSAAAFLANGVSGIEAVVQFGLSAAVALIVAFVVLGVLAPLLVHELEQGRGGRKCWWRRVVAGAGFVLMALVGGVAVTMAVMMPAVGAALVAVFTLLFVAAPAGVRRWRGARRVEPTPTRAPRRRSSGAGRLTGFTARHRRVVLPLVGGLAVAGLVLGTKVDSRFSVDDFFAEDTDFIVSLDLATEHYGDSEGRTGLLYVEGDLTDPAALAGLADTEATLEAADTPLARQEDGSLTEYSNALHVAQATVASPFARAAVQDRTGVAVTDVDGDGLPDDPEQTAAVYETALAEGVAAPDGSTLLVADDVAGVLWTDGEAWATTIVVGIPTITDAGIIDGARDALESVGDELTSGPAAGSISVAAVAGDAILDQAGQDAFTRAMLLALPIALAAGFAAAAVFMRSVRYAVVAVLPVLLVIVGIYAFMYGAGFAVNPVTATIAAIAVGVGIDFGTHLTIRFREELGRVGEPYGAVVAAGSGTGAALVMSALTSVLGFAVMALAPMPIFATFGLLTAVMIALSLLVALVVLPGLLVLVAPRSKGGPASTDARPESVEVDLRPAADRPDEERALAPVSSISLAVRR